MRLLAALLVLFAAAAAFADPQLDPTKKDAASKLVADGSVLFEQHDYTAALAKYREAYSVYPAAKLHYNVALALDGLGRADEAADEYALFLDGAADAPADARSQAQDQLGKLESKLALLAINSGAGNSTVEIDGKPRGSAPASVHVEAGKHEITVHASGRDPWTATVDVAAGAHRSVDAYPLSVRLDHDPSPSPAKHDVGGQGPERESGSVAGKWWFWTAVAVVVVGGAVIAYEVTREPSAPASELGVFQF
jgi:hypothetical protein